MLATSGVVAACFLGAGAAALALRGHRRIGLLLVAIGLLWTVTMVLPAGNLRVAVVGAWAAALAHLVVAHPTGRLGRPGRALSQVIDRENGAGASR
ncbi:MAG: hypothetical protein HOV79_05340 [Hamadaea sp.]|nr:hypothetical protein [Hamadaea sp.]